MQTFVHQEVDYRLLGHLNRRSHQWQLSEFRACCVCSFSEGAYRYESSCHSLDSIPFVYRSISRRSKNQYKKYTKGMVYFDHVGRALARDLKRTAKRCTWERLYAIAWPPLAHGNTKHVQCVESLCCKSTAIEVDRHKFLKLTEAMWMRKCSNSNHH